MAKVSVKAMTEDEGRACLSEIGRRGGKARALQFTPVSQRAARRNLSSEQAAAKGSKGAQRTIELHGYKAHFEGSRRKRLANPSPNELVMMGLLKTIGLKFDARLLSREYFTVQSRRGVIFLSITAAKVIQRMRRRKERWR